MTNKKQLEQLEVCIYMQPWWLDIVAEDSWDVVVSEKGGTIRGVWVYVEREKAFLKQITMPSLTKYNGVYFVYPENQKLAKKYSFEHVVLADLIQKLPKVNTLNQTFSPEFSNHLQLYWDKFRQTTRVTYKLSTNTKTEDELWSGIVESTRRQIKKAEKSFVVEMGDEFDALAVNRALFKRKSMPLPFDEIILKKLVKTSVEKSQGVVLTLKENNLLVASAWFVWDKKTFYYQGGSALDDYTNSGAMSRLVWEGIKIAQELNLSFDFEGSMLQPIERFFRGFGAEQIPYYSISKGAKWIHLVKLLLNKE